MSLPRNLPSWIEGYGAVLSYGGAVRRSFERRAEREAEGLAVLPDLAAALRECGVGAGARLSFHHHLRNGDLVLNAVMEAAAGLGLEGLELAPSSVFGVHAPLVGHMERGVVAGLRTGYMAGPVAEAVGRGVLSRPVVLQTHGGRARAIEAGEMVVDVAFVAASMVDRAGNMTGAAGPEAFGPMGYPMVDAGHARRVMAVTDCLVDRLPCAPDIAGAQVDHIVVVPRIGEAARIVSGTTQITRDPLGVRIAEMSAELIAASGLMREGMSFQTGAGGTSLAVAEALGRRMAAAGVVGGFAAGGITAPLVRLFREGLFREMWDVQCFDPAGVESYLVDGAHRGMSASRYASPARDDAIVDRLDVVILGAAEVDLGFNVNVTTGSDGRILGGSGGHSDCAAGAKLAIITTQLGARGVPKIVERVRMVTTPGESIGAVVTEAGIAVNPARPELRARAVAAGLPVVEIGDLLRLAPEAAAQVRGEGRVLAVGEYRDGRVIDVLRGALG